LQLFYS